MVSWLLLSAWATAARGDGGVVRVVEQQAGFQISVFTSPNPLRAGPVDISVLVQDAETGQPLPEADIRVAVTPRGRSGRSLPAAATTEAATNKLLRAAVLQLPDAGWWDVDVVCITQRRRAHVHFAMECGPPLPHWLTVWPWFVWPVGVVLLFGIHRMLVWRRHAPQAPAERRSASESLATALSLEHHAQHA
jgi:hypothetical protein